MEWGTVNDSSLQYLSDWGARRSSDPVEQTLQRVRFNDHTLELLELPNQRLRYRDARELSNALAKNTQITSLDLHDNQLGSKGMWELAVGICRHPRISRLDVANNQIDRGGAEAIYAVIGHIVSHKLPGLRMINLSGNPLHDAGLAIMALAVERYNDPNLEYLALGGIETKDDIGWVRLAYALEKHRDLDVLDLHGNSLRAGGAIEAVAVMLVTHHLGLRRLDLASCRIDDNGAEVFASILKHIPANMTNGPCLAKLVLRDNQIHDQGAEALFAELVKLPYLIDVDLAGNPISNKLLTSLHTQLKCNRHKTLIDAQCLRRDGEALLDAGNPQQGREYLHQAWRLIEMVDEQSAGAFLTARKLATKQMEDADNIARAGQANLQAGRYPQARAAFMCVLSLWRDHQVGLKGLKAVDAVTAATPPDGDSIPTSTAAH